MTEQVQNKSLPLAEFHKKAGARIAAPHGFEVAISYGDSAAEYEALQSSVGLLDVSGVALVTAEGKDVADYLNRRLSQRVIDVAPGAGVRAFQLDAVGKMEADLEYFQVEAGRALLLSPPTQGGADLAALCDKYVFSEDAKFTDVSDAWVAFALIGPKAADAVKEAGFAPPEGDNRIAFAGDHFVVRSGYFLDGIVVIAPINNREATWEKFAAGCASCGGRAIGWDAFNAARIERGLAWWRIDFGVENIPLEADLMDGIHTNKGCYPGQETIAKTMNLGHPAKRLVGVTWEGSEPIATPAPLKLKDRQVGTLTSFAHSPKLGKGYGLAIVRFLYAEDDMEVFTEDGREGIVRTQVAL